VIRAGGGGNAECVGDGVLGARTTGDGDGGGGTHKLQQGAQRRRGSARGPRARGPQTRAGSGWLKAKECRGGRCR
jgi:hypothetical protein